LAPHLAVGDDVEAGALLVADRQQGRVVLRLVEELGRDAPQLFCAHARRKAAGELLAVDQPFGLGVGPDQRGRQQRQGHHVLPAVLAWWRRGGSRGATCSAGRPARWWIWWRQGVRSATMMASWGALRTAGNSESSPIASETSIVSAP